jgi:hypothetical protein
MSNIDKQDLNSQAVPFFARYLEGQFGEELSEEEMAAVGGGANYVTMAYPSDTENDGGPVMTLKYPSDIEDDGGGLPDPSNYTPTLPEFPAIPDFSWPGAETKK